MMPIPNYWGDETSDIGLFIPAYYSDRAYSNDNGNQDIDTAFSELMDVRDELRVSGSALQYDKFVMYHPVEPSEMMRPTGFSFLPKQEAMDRLSYIQHHKIFEKSMIGWLDYDVKSKYGVRFNLDVKKELDPIVHWSDNDKKNTKGAFIMYEQPPIDIPEGLYYVVYDPTAQSGKGSSFNSVLVYKAVNNGIAELSDTIVGEWIGRLDMVEDNWDMCIKIAKFFNAKILPEYNTAGFIDECRRRNLFNMLAIENIALKKELNPKTKSEGYKRGYRMDTRHKSWAIKQANSHLMTPVEETLDGVVTKRVIDTINSVRLLEEIV